MQKTRLIHEEEEQESDEEEGPDEEDYSYDGGEYGKVHCTCMHIHVYSLCVCKLIVSHLSIFYYCVLDRILGEVWNMR